MSISGPIRKAEVTGPYLDLNFPDFFRVDTLTESGHWLEWGAYYAEQVQRIEDGTYGLLSDGYPFLIRCIADHGDFIVHVDGDGKGEIHYYRIVPLDPIG
jgi:hypothetical protein